MFASLLFDFALLFEEIYFVCRFTIHNLKPQRCRHRVVPDKGPHGRRRILVCLRINPYTDSAKEFNKNSSEIVGKNLNLFLRFVKISCLLSNVRFDVLCVK
jgi:hypothetical protein